jgi:hypothetical protein
MAEAARGPGGRRRNALAAFGARLGPPKAVLEGTSSKLYFRLRRDLHFRLHRDLRANHLICYGERGGNRTHDPLIKSHIF